MIDASEFSNPAIAKRVAETQERIRRHEKVTECAFKIHALLLELETLNLLNYNDGETFTIMNLALRVKRGYQT